MNCGQFTIGLSTLTPPISTKGEGLKTKERSFRNTKGMGFVFGGMRQWEYGLKSYVMMTPFAQATHAL